MNDLTNPSRQQILTLQSEVAKLPQLEVRTEHLFTQGIYVRKMWIPAGAIIVGKIHKAEHFFMLMYGDMIVYSENGSARITGGHVSIGMPGTKRVGLALTDSVGLNVHRTDKTDLDEIEADLIEYEPEALFDARNQLKGGLLCGPQ